MIEFPYKRVWALLGAPRSGKDTVSKYLQETRGFEVLAFGDQIKTEFGISIEDFEALKITGEIEELRKKLWAFSEQKKSEDPDYFIRGVMSKAINSKKSVVISDIRTEREFNALFTYIPSDLSPRVYGVDTDKAGAKERYEDDYRIVDTKISRDFYCHHTITTQNIKVVDTVDGLFKFFKHLDKYFFKEDIMDLSDPEHKIRLANKYYGSEVYTQKEKDKLWGSVLSNYIDQFNIG